MKPIREFRGETRYLSNFAFGEVEVYGWVWKGREVAFQAMKCLTQEEFLSFLPLTNQEAKTKGRAVQLRPDWEEIKDEVMYYVCKAFFEQHTEERNKLLATEDTYLEEGNKWHDRYWGVCYCDRCKGTGRNTLGRLLMRIRTELMET